MSGGAPAGFHRLGVFQLRALHLLFQGRDDYHVTYAELSEDGAPLFAVYRRARAATVQDGPSR